MWHSIVTYIHQILDTAEAVPEDGCWHCLVLGGVVCPNLRGVELLLAAAYTAQSGADHWPPHTVGSHTAIYTLIVGYPPLSI